MYNGFIQFQHILRFGDKDFLSAGINQGKCYLFPKIDGENCCIWRAGNGMRYGKRKKEVFTDEESGGLITAVNSVPAFRLYLEKHPDHRLYGELMTHKKKIKSYVDGLWGGFYVFDVCRVIETANGIELEYIPYDVYKPLLDECGVPYIPLLSIPGVGNGIVINPSVDDLMKYVNGNTWMIKPGKGIGEGIIIKNYNFRNRRGEFVYAKIVASGMANDREAARQGEMKKIQNLTSGKNSEQASTAKSLSRYSKGIEAKVINKYFGLQQLRINGNAYLSHGLTQNDTVLMLMKDVFDSRIVDIVTDYKQPILDFNLLFVLINGILTSNITDKEFLHTASAESEDSFRQRLSRYDGLFEERIIDTYVTNEYVEKEYYKFMEGKDSWEKRYIPFFVRHVYNTFLSEELFNAAAYFSLPILDFNKFPNLVSAKIKVVKPDLYGGVDKIHQDMVRKEEQKKARLQRKQAEAASLLISPLKPGEILDEEFQRSLQYYEGDLSWIMANRTLPLVAQNWEFWNDLKAYNSINSMFFPELSTELARSAEGKNLNPAIMTNIGLLRRICKGVFNCMVRNPTPEGGYRTYRVDRLKDVNILKSYGCTMAFTSTSTAGFLEEYCNTKYDVVLLEFVIGPNIPCAYMEKLLNKYQKTNEAEITLPPFVRVKLNQVPLNSKESKLRDQKGHPPVAKYMVNLEWNPQDIKTAFPQLANNPDALNAYENVQIYAETRDLIIRLCNGLNSLKGTSNVPSSVSELMIIGHFTDEDIRKIYAMKQSFRRTVLSDFKSIVARCGKRFLV